MTMTRRDAAATGVLVALIALLFSDALFFGRAFYFRDLTRFYYPSKELLADMVRGGEFPSWNPNWAAGQPLAANPDYGAFYPLQWLTFLPGFDFWFRLLIVMHIAIAAVGAYFLLRRWLRVESAIFGAIVFSLGGLTLSLINLLPFLYCFAWLPWIAFAIDHRRFAAAALLLAVAIIGGEPVTIAQVCILIVAFAFVRKVPWHRMALVFLAAIAIAAVQLLPAVDLLRDTARSRGFPVEVVGQWSTPLVRLVDLFIPQFTGPGVEHFRLYWGTARYGWLDPFYVGIYFGLLPLALALAGLFTRLPGWRSVSAVLGLSVALALGNHTPLLQALYSIKILSSFRYPEKCLILGLVPTMFFSAFAFDRAVFGDRRIIRRALLIAVATTALSALLCVASLQPSYAARFVDFWGIAVHPLAGKMIHLSRSVWLAALIRSAIGTTVLLLAKRRRWAYIAIAAVFLDLGYERLSIADTVSGDFFRTPSPALRQIDRNIRVFHQADWYGATFIARRYLDLPEMYWVLRNGLYPMVGATWHVSTAMNRDIDETFLTPAADFDIALGELRRRNAPRWFEPLMAMSSAGYRAMYLPFRRPSDPRSIEPIIFVPMRTNPIFYFADGIARCRSRDEFIDLAPRATPRIALADIEPFTPARGRVIAIRQRSNAAEADVDSAGDALLVCSITRHKYWRATVDGREAQLIPVNLQYQGMRIPKGRHTIRLQYRNPLFVAGGAISIAALALLVALILRERHNVGEEIVEAPLELGAGVH